MSVYVDAAIHPWRGKMWCHLFSEDLEELHTFAARLGLNRSWFQVSQSGFPHYDITQNKRNQALDMGAIYLELVKAVAMMKKIRKNFLEEIGDS